LAVFRLPDTIDTKSGRRTKNKCGLIDKTGKVVAEPEYVRIRHFSEGRAVYVVRSAGGRDMYGFLRQDGTRLTQPVFESANDYKGGLAYVKTPQGWVYANHQGKVVYVPPRK
jgi:hypothetical protein